MKLNLLILAIAPLFFPGQACAFGDTGHQTVGQIAQDNLKSHARAMVKSLLGKATLRDAGPWGDCVKGISSNGGQYPKPPTGKTVFRASCAAFENPAGKAEIEAYAAANWERADCPDETGKGCHRQFHFADIAIQRSAYADEINGAPPWNIVHAINACIEVLKGNPSPAPFAIPNKRVAVLLLAHLMGDLHQPLHVGSVYLNGDQLVDPDAGGGAVNHNHKSDPTFTQGGNFLYINDQNLHSIWDGVSVSPATLTQLKAAAKAIPADTSPVESRAQAWATESLLLAAQNLGQLQFRRVVAKHWAVSKMGSSGTVDVKTYRDSVRPVQRTQMAKAGRRLADILNAIWP